MAGKKRDKIKAKDLVGFKYFKVLAGMLETLHDAACARDRAHNRILHMDQYITLLLMYMFNPICSSLRAVQEASDLKKVQRVLNVPRSSLGSLSEAARVFDSDLLIGIIGELVHQLRPIRRDAKLTDFDQIITLIDGSWLRAVPKMTWALFRNDNTHRAIKAHVHVELLKGVPVAATITDANTSEHIVLAEHLEAGRLYVLDRGYAKYDLLRQVLDADSSFVCRLPDNAVFEVAEERQLDQDALNAGIVRDAVVRLGCKFTRGKLNRPVRIIEIECMPHRKPSGKTARGGPEQGDTILVVTDRMDLPADVVGLIYQRRWQIEIFFRFFKHVLGCRHLLSTNKNGIELETYAAIIACLLMALWTGRKPTLEMNVLRSKTPPAVRREVASIILGHNLVWMLMHESAQKTNTPADDISFAGAVKTVLAFSWALRHAQHRSRNRLYDRMLRHIARQRNHHPFDRVEPRLVKREPVRFGYLREPRWKARLKCLS